MHALLIAVALQSLTAQVASEPSTAPSAETETAAPADEKWPANEEAGTGGAGDTAIAPPPAAEASDAAPAAAPATDSPRLMGALAEPDPGQQRLIAGAPLYNPNVAVHIVQKKQITDRGRHEITLYPATAQVNGKFTQHFGTALAYTYHLHENLGIQLIPQYNWVAREAAFNLELVDKVRQQGQPATTLLLNWAATGGVEVTPLYGKFAIYDGLLAQFNVVLSGGAGLGQTSHLLKPRTYGQGGERFAETYGDTGRKFVGHIGGGFRIQVGDRFTARLEIRDLVYSARVDQVNGCNATDLDTLFAAYGSQDNPDDPLAGVQVRSSCNLGAFQGFDEGTGEERIHDIPRARDLVREPSSDVLNNVSFNAGFSVIF